MTGVITLSTIEVPTRLGALPAKYQYLKHPTGSSKLAVVFPGQKYTLDAPLMWYSAKATFEAGCDVLKVEYGYQANRSELGVNELEYLIEEALGALENLVTGDYSSVVFIGKSIGTIVQSEVSQKLSFKVRNHVFLTPLSRVIPLIRQSENSLVIVGDSDNAFLTSDIAKITDLSNVQLHVISGADHGLETEDYRTSLDILKETTLLCGDFCKNLL